MTRPLSLVMTLPGATVDGGWKVVGAVAPLPIGL